MSDELSKKPRIPGLDDDGPTRIAIIPDIMRGMVHMEFTKPINRLGFTVEEAIAIGKMLLEKASQVAARAPKRRA